VTRLWPALVLAPAVLLAACGPATEGPSADATAEAAAIAAIDPKAAAEAAARTRRRRTRWRRQKPAFDAALATGDPLAIDDLADAGQCLGALSSRTRSATASARLHRSSRAASRTSKRQPKRACPEALMWVGRRKAYGQSTAIKLQPNSGLILMERAARQRKCRGDVRGRRDVRAGHLYDRRQEGVRLVQKACG
jgi:hypothetical protein